MKKLNNYNILYDVVIVIITMILAITNNILCNKLEAYKAYYNASETLFEEIEDYNENLFDTDKAIDYYKSKEELPISK
jgi:hypothetical protein